MGEQKRPDLVMTADGDLVPTGEIKSDLIHELSELKDFPLPKPAEQKPAEPKPKVELPAFPRPQTPPAPAPIVAKRRPPPPPPADTPPPYMGSSGSLADDLALPSRPPPPPSPPPPTTARRVVRDEDLSSPAEVESALRDRNYRKVMEQIADIDGDESLDDEAIEIDIDLPQPQSPTPDIPVIRGTALAPPPARRVPATNVVPEDPSPRRGPPRVINRVIKERNRGR